jgi:hypothetical protein
MPLNVVPDHDQLLGLIRKIDTLMEDIEGFPDLMYEQMETWERTELNRRRHSNMSQPDRNTVMTILWARGPRAITRSPRPRNSGRPRGGPVFPKGSWGATRGGARHRRALARIDVRLARIARMSRVILREPLMEALKVRMRELLNRNIEWR